MTDDTANVELPGRTGLQVLPEVRSTLRQPRAPGGPAWDPGHG